MEKIKDLKLNKDIFGIEPNDKVLYDAIMVARNGMRQGTYSTKTRAEVSGGGRKPWRQKGTGRARQGSIRAPHWVGGEVALGPQPRNYQIKMNRKERVLALRSALSYKARDKEIVIVDNFDIAGPKTKDMLSVLKELELVDKKVLLVMDELTENVILASRNLANILVMEPAELNVYDIVNSDVLLMSKASVKEVEEALK